LFLTEWLSGWWMADLDQWFDRLTTNGESHFDSVRFEAVDGHHFGTAYRVWMKVDELLEFFDAGQDFPTEQF
jgi:hypothetical protein